MRINEYEAMFLLENNAATADFEGTAGQVDEILQKHGAELVQKEKWDERKLAYEIKGQRRATYYLVYLRCDPANMREIGIDLGLNQIVLRHLFIRLDEPIATHVEKRDNERELLAEDSRKHSLSGWGRRDRRSKGGGSRSSKPGEDGESIPDGGEGAAATAVAVAPASDAPAPAPAPDAPAPDAPAPDAPAPEAPATDAAAAEAPAAAADAPATDTSSDEGKSEA